MGKVKSHFSLGIPMMGIPRAETLIERRRQKSKSKQRIFILKNQKEKRKGKKWRKTS